jgi:hypothetical protein
VSYEQPERNITQKTLTIRMHNTSKDNFSYQIRILGVVFTCDLIAGLQQESVCSSTCLRRGLSKFVKETLHHESSKVEGQGSAPSIAAIWWVLKLYILVAGARTAVDAWRKCTALCDA